MLDIEGFILVGGASSRMGTDKTRLQLAGQNFVERIAAALGSITGRVSLVGAKLEGTGWHLPSVPDIYQGWGALGGLHGALAACRAEWAAIVACDLPFVTGQLFVRLASRRETFDAVAPVQTDGRPQPLCALYRREPCLRRAQALITNGERRPLALLRAVQTRWIPPAQLADVGDPTLFFTNVNTPGDYANAKEKGEKRMGER